MSLSDPIGDMIARVKNAQARNHKKVELPSSNFKSKIADIIKNDVFIKDFKFASDVLLRNKIGVLIKLNTCETCSNFNIFDDRISKLSINFTSISPFFSTANTKKFSEVKILL